MAWWEQELPNWITGYMGYCPFCNKDNMLLFLLEDSKGRYEHCMICNKDWRLEKQ